AFGDPMRPFEAIAVVIVFRELEPGLRHRGELVGPIAQLLGRTHGPRILRSDLFALSGTLLNAGTVLIGGVLGTFLGDRLPERVRANVVRGIGLFVMVMGVKFAIDTASLLYALGSILLGGIAGTLAGVDRGLVAFGDMLQRRFARPGSTSTVSEGFVTAAIVFCVGPLTFLGSIQNGLTGD